MKQAVKESAPHSGIMSIGTDVRKLVDKKVNRWIESAKRQGQDIDKMGEQELKYLIEINKPKAPKVYSNEEAYGILNRFMNQNKRGEVIKGKFGKPFAEEIVTVERVVTDIKKLEPIDAMKEANKVLRGEGRYKSLSKADREKIVNDESVTDHIFERNIEPDPEDFAQGGRTGLSYLLAEDTNERMPFSMGRRAFLKLMGGAAAGIGALKTGALKLFGKEGATVAKEVTQVPIKNIEGMPSWFKPLVNKVIKEGTDVTKKNAYKERMVVHKTKLPESKTDVYVHQDLDSGDVSVQIGVGKHGFADGHYGQPVRLEYKAAEDIMTGPSDEPFKVGERDPLIKVKRRDEFSSTDPNKTPEEFWVEEAEFSGGHPENVKFEEVSVNKFGQHESNFDEVEKFATGKVKKVKKQKGSSPISTTKFLYEGDDFASGGIAKMLGE